MNKDQLDDEGCPPPVLTLLCNSVFGTSLHGPLCIKLMCMKRAYLILDGSQPSSLGGFSPLWQAFRKLRWWAFSFGVSVLWPPKFLHCYHSLVILTVNFFFPFQFCIQRFINFVFKLGKFSTLSALTFREMEDHHFLWGFNKNTFHCSDASRILFPILASGPTYKVVK